MKRRRRTTGWWDGSLAGSWWGALPWLVLLLVVGRGLVSCGAQEAPTHVADAPVQCGKQGGLVLQVLGSGGPIADDGRASSGYLIWQDGRARLLVEAGGGVFLRFGESGARMEDLDAIAITHLHADHVADLAALLKSGYFIDRNRPLPVYGPDGNERFPPMDAFVDTLLNAEDGAFAYLSGYQEGSPFPLPVTALASAAQAPTTVFDSDGMTIEAVGVKHGTIPAIGYVVTIDGVRVAFAGDQSADNDPFIALAKDADVLVMHHAIPEEGFDGVTHLHAKPSEMGRAAAKANAKQLVLGHHMQRALKQSAVTLLAISQHYSGPVDLAADLSCYVLQP